jgi:tRNA U34 5-carboxymethylaminomethyl modifying GTPase MnmE/TrmE
LNSSIRASSIVNNPDRRDKPHYRITSKKLTMTSHHSIHWPDYWRRLREALLKPQVSSAALDAALREARARQPLPVLWLIGKAQAGKTSIIRALTGSEAAEIGNGFQPCTRTARFYDFPTEAPVVRFLDTRGLGEVAYDPTEDIRYCEAQAHLLLG